MFLVRCNISSLRGPNDTILWISRWIWLMRTIITENTPKPIFFGPVDFVTIEFHLPLLILEFLSSCKHGYPDFGVNIFQQLCVIPDINNLKVFGMVFKLIATFLVRNLVKMILDALSYTVGLLLLGLSYSFYPVLNFFHPQESEVKCTFSFLAISLHVL